MLHQYKESDGTLVYLGVLITFQSPSIYMLRVQCWKFYFYSTGGGERKGKGPDPVPTLRLPVSVSTSDLVVRCRVSSSLGTERCTGGQRLTMSGMWWKFDKSLFSPLKIELTDDIKKTYKHIKHINNVV